MSIRETQAVVEWTAYALGFTDFELTISTPPDVLGYTHVYIDWYALRDGEKYGNRIVVPRKENKRGCLEILQNAVHSMIAIDREKTKSLALASRS